MKECSFKFQTEYDYRATFLCRRRRRSSSSSFFIDKMNKINDISNAE